MGTLTLTTLVATSDFKNRLVFTDWCLQACKSFIALATSFFVPNLAHIPVFAQTSRWRVKDYKSVWTFLSSPFQSVQGPLNSYLPIP